MKGTLFMCDNDFIKEVFIMNRKVAILYADGFEDTEALATRDILVRAGIEIYDLRVENNLDKDYVKASHGINLAKFHLASDFDPSMFDAVILPGGGLGTQNLLRSSEVERYLKVLSKEHKLLCAICAAPMVLGKYGYLHNKRFTCFKGCNEGLDGIFTASEVEVDDNIVTGRAMLYSVKFGLKIAELLLGKDTSDRVARQITGI